MLLGQRVARLAFSKDLNLSNALWSEKHRYASRLAATEGLRIMDVMGFLLLGFLIGMSHALEIDHLAAVSTLMTDGKGSKKRLMFRGAVWGVGHTLTLFAICSIVVVLGFTLTQRMSAALEMGVGVMLVVLGLDVVRRFRKERLHFHGHTHGDGKAHIHVHSHRQAPVSYNSDAHSHEHRAGFPIKALIIGLVHGAAGSAGLLTLAVAATQSITTALLYVGMFGIGSIIGMAALTYAVAWPLSWVERGMGWAYGALRLSAAALAFGMGVYLILETSPIVLGAA
ncbi:MAG: high frequency lysogenization protein HflD [Hyphomonas sp.]